jgi:hypothetical protein
MASLFRLSNFDLHGSSACGVLLLMSIVLLFPAHAQPEIVILSVSDLEEVQPSSANQEQERADSGDAFGLVISILLIAAAAAVGVGMKRLSRKKTRQDKKTRRKT